MTLGSIGVYVHLHNDSPLSVRQSPRVKTSRSPATPRAHVSPLPPSGGSSGGCQILRGDTTKYFDYTGGAKPQERVYVDRCAETVPKAMTDATLSDHIQFALSGGNAAVFSMIVGASNLPSALRMNTFLRALNHLEELIAKSCSDMSVSYVMLGLTDKDCVNLATEVKIPLSQLSDKFDAQHRITTSVADISDLLRQDVRLPFLVSIRLTTMEPTPRAGHLCLIDLGAPILGTTITPAVPLPGISKSVQNLVKVAHILVGQDKVFHAPTHDTPLTLLTQDLVGGQAKTSFLFHLATEQSSPSELLTLLDFFAALSKMRCRQVINRVDPRVSQLHTQVAQSEAKHVALRGEIRKLQGIMVEQESITARVQAQFEEQAVSHRKHLEECSSQIVDLQQQLEHERAKKFDQAAAAWAAEKLLLEDEIRETKVLLLHIETEAERAKSSAQGGKNDVDKLGRRFLTVQDDYIEVYEKYTKLKSTHSGLTKKFTDLQGQLDEQLGSLESERGELRTANDFLTSRLDEAKADQYKLQNQLTKFQERCEAAQQQAKQARADYDLLRDRMQELDKERQSERQRADEARANQAKLQEQIKGLDETCTNERLRSSVLEGQIAELRWQLSQAKRESPELAAPQVPIKVSKSRSWHQANSVESEMVPESAATVDIDSEVEGATGSPLAAQSGGGTKRAASSSPEMEPATLPEETALRGRKRKKQKQKQAAKELEEISEAAPPQRLLRRSLKAGISFYAEDKWDDGIEDSDEQSLIQSESSPERPKRKGRATKRKSQSDDNYDEGDSDEQPLSEPELSLDAPKRRGRPPKRMSQSGDNYDEGDSTEQPLIEPEPSPEPPKRRGRPPKRKSQSGDNYDEGDSTEQPLIEPEPSPEPPKRRGRPPKRMSQSGDNYDEGDSTEQPLIEPEPSPEPPKRRGRPPKRKSQSDDNYGQADSTEQPLIEPEPSPEPPKRRGRPPKRKNQSPCNTACAPVVPEPDSPAKPQPSKVKSIQIPDTMAAALAAADSSANFLQVPQRTSRPLTGKDRAINAGGLESQLGAISDGESGNESQPECPGRIDRKTARSLLRSPLLAQVEKARRSSGISESGAARRLILDVSVPDSPSPAVRVSKSVSAKPGPLRDGSVSPGLPLVEAKVNGGGDGAEAKPKDQTSRKVLFKEASPDRAPSPSPSPPPTTSPRITDRPQRRAKAMSKTCAEDDLSPSDLSDSETEVRTLKSKTKGKHKRESSAASKPSLTRSDSATSLVSASSDPPEAIDVAGGSLNHQRPPPPLPMAHLNAARLALQAKSATAVDGDADGDATSVITSVTQLGGGPLGAKEKRKRNLAKRMVSLGVNLLKTDPAIDKPSRNSLSLGFKVPKNF